MTLVTFHHNNGEVIHCYVSATHLSVIKDKHRKVTFTLKREITQRTDDIGC